MSSSPRHCRRSRVERASSLDLASSSSSLFRRFQGKKSSTKTPNESLGASQPPPRHSHRRILSRDRKRPMAIYYSSNSTNYQDESKLTATSRSVDATEFTDGEMSEDEVEDQFDRDTKLPDFAATATPRYRDRLTEVHRVMAAGKLSRRRGSSEKKMYVISSRWLRDWLAFTSSASRSSRNLDYDYGFDSEKSISSPTNEDTASSGRAPGPINNLPLLELSRGKLVRRPGLIRDEAIAGDAASAGEDADFQLLSPEVWEVFQRLYGGSPAIYVNLTSADPAAWNIDISGSKQQPPKSPAWTVTSSSSSSSLSEDKERVRSPMNSGKMQLEDLESDVAALSIGVVKTPAEGEDDMRATTSTRSPTAALAASAFAVAMKQARLNAQKAIDDPQVRARQENRRRGALYDDHELVLEALSNLVTELASGF
eukprot:jgi/Phyca11/532013/estExt2_fgenesh1_pg.C_PHYCAscaffold_30186